MSGQVPPLTAREIARVCGITQRTLRRWVGPQHPAPFERLQRGTRYYFEPIKFAGWLRINEKHEEYSRLTGYLAGLHREGKAPPREEIERSIHEYQESRQCDAAEAQRKALAENLHAAERPLPPADSALEPRRYPQPERPDEYPGAEESQPAAAHTTGWDIFKVRDNTARMYTQAVRMFVYAPAGEKIPHQKNANAVAELLRKLELDCITVAKEMGLIMRVSDAEKLIGSICSRVKHDLLNMPYAVADDLATIDDPERITEVLTERITDALRHLSDALTHLEMTQ